MYGGYGVRGNVRTSFLLNEAWGTKERPTEVIVVLCTAQEFNSNCNLEYHIFSYPVCSRSNRRTLCTRRWRRYLQESFIHAIHTCCDVLRLSIVRILDSTLLFTTDYWYDPFPQSTYSTCQIVCSCSKKTVPPFGNKNTPLAKWTWIIYTKCQHNWK